MKKLSPISILVIMFLLLALSGCFDSSSDSGDSSAGNTPPTSPLPPPGDIETGPERTCAAVIPTGNCSDGLDNDGDGLVDWQEDLGCSGPFDDEEVDCRENEDGWTTYDPHPTDTDIIYVSSSLGDDAYSGFAPEWDGTDGPVQTVAAAVALVRDNSADWILFKRGDTWTDESIDRSLELKSGLSPEYPIIIASYSTNDNSTARPKFNYSDSPWYRTLQSTLTNLSILGLELNQYKLDPNNANFNPGARSAAFGVGGGNILFEDCKISYAEVNIGDNNGGYFELRRNILTNSYSVISHAQSIFTNTSSPLLIEGNVMNHGGWNDEFRLVLTAPETTVATWTPVANGQFDIQLEGTLFQISGLDFSSASNLTDVAQALENGVNAVTAPNTVSISFTTGGAIKIASTDYLSNPNYSISAYTGGVGGTDISVAGWLNATVSGVPESTIFNRNMYLSHGLGNTAVIGNIDANGGSGGTQLRMGGIMDNNLFLQNPISIVIGSSQNDPQNVSAIVKNNVILGSRNIDTQLQGKGIGISSYLADNGYGPSWIENVEVYNNIIAHASSEAQFNIRGIDIQGDAPHVNLNIHNNIVYNWTNPNWASATDHRAYGFTTGDLNPTTTNSFFQNNIIQQPVSGFVGYSYSNPPLTITGNTYYSAETDPPAIWSQGWFDVNGFGSVSSTDWFSETGDTSTALGAHIFNDPTRDIARYHTEVCGGGASFDAFIAQALLQSRLNWDNRYTADAVNTWIRTGFDLTYQE